jgi:hypothetical protein
VNMQGMRYRPGRWWCRACGTHAAHLTNVCWPCRARASVGSGKTGWQAANIPALVWSGYVVLVEMTGKVGRDTYQKLRNLGLPLKAASSRAGGRSDGWQSRRVVCRTPVCIALHWQERPAGSRSAVLWRTQTETG